MYFYLSLLKIAGFYYAVYHTNSSIILALLPLHKILRPWSQI